MAESDNTERCGTPWGDWRSEKEASGLYSTLCDPYYNLDFIWEMQTRLSEVESLKRVGANGIDQEATTEN